MPLAEESGHTGWGGRKKVSSGTAIDLVTAELLCDCDQGLYPCRLFPLLEGAPLRARKQHMTRPWQLLPAKPAKRRSAQPAIRRTEAGSCSHVMCPLHPPLPVCRRVQTAPAASLGCSCQFPGHLMCRGPWGYSLYLCRLPPVAHELRAEQPLGEGGMCIGVGRVRDWLWDKKS